MNSPVIAIFDRDTIRAAGLRSIIRMHSDSVTVVTPLSPDELTAEPSLCFVSPEILAAHAAWFVSRRAVTAVIGSGPSDSFATLNPEENLDVIIETTGEMLSRAARRPSKVSASLSPREIDVLRLLAAGHINKEIASMLHISINTVLSHRKNITAKLGIKSASALGIYAAMNGLINQ